MPWLSLARRLWPVAAGAAVLLLAWWQVRAYADRVADAREASVRALWTADTAARDKAAADAIAAQAANAEAQRAQNAKELEDANAKLAAVTADRDSVYGLLQRAGSQVRALAAAEATGQRGIDALAGVAARAAEVDRRLADYDAACRRDAVRFEALQREIRGQL